MQMALNHESALALKTTADKTGASIKQIEEATVKLKAQYAALMENLGVHAEDFKQLISLTEKAIKKAKDSTEVLLPKIYKASEDIENYVNRKMSIIGKMVFEGNVKKYQDLNSPFTPKDRKTALSPTDSIKQMAQNIYQNPSIPKADQLRQLRSLQKTLGGNQVLYSKYKDIKSLQLANDGEYDKAAVTNAKELSSDEKTSVHYYTTNEGYGRINKFCITGETAGDKATLQKQVDDLESAISKSTLENDTRLYRGESLEHIINPLRPFIGDLCNKIVPGADPSTYVEELNEQCKGKIFTTPCFCSTSVNKGNAEGFLYKNIPCIMHIKAPKGANALNVGRVGYFKDWEKEILLQKDSIFYIEKIDLYNNIPRIRVALIGRKN